MKSLTIKNDPEKDLRTQDVTTETKDKISLYYSIFELPIERFTAFQKYLIQDAGIGNTINSIAERFQTLYSFLAAGKTVESVNEATNLHYAFFYGLEQINISHYSFACLIHSINDEECTDFEESGLKETIRRISQLNIKESQLREYLSEVKKNLIES